MKLHRNCVTDPVAKEYWRDYQHVIKEGNPLGLSFTEYVAVRVSALAPRTVTSASSSDTVWLIAECGHRHPWGMPCSVWTSQ